MTYEIKVPPLGESIVEATVSKWVKQVGEAIAPGEAVVELETDKVNLEVPAEQGGVLASIAKGEGEVVKIGDLLATVEAVSVTPGDRKPTTASDGKSQPAAASQPLPPVNGQRVAAGSDVPATPVATEMATKHGIDLRTIPGTGPGGRVTKEDVLKAIDRRDDPSGRLPSPSGRLSTPPPVAPASAPGGPAPTSASASAVVAPVPGVPAPEPASVPVPITTTPPIFAEVHRDAPLQSPISTARPEERRRMSRRRQTIARRLVEAQRTAAMLTTFNEVDMSAVMALRQRRKDSFKERHGVGLGFMSFFARTVIGALKAFPLLNAEIQGDEIVVKHYYDIGVAVGTEEGLVVPVVRDADRKSFAEIEREIGDLAQRARAGTLTLPELQGGTFTITNGGIYGSLMSTPILNAPQVGILGMHKIEERPVVIKGEIVVRPMMYVALSYDHRIVDGSEAVRFLVRVKELIEDPEALLLEG